MAGPFVQTVNNSSNAGAKSPVIESFRAFSRASIVVQNLSKMVNFRPWFDPVQLSALASGRCQVPTFLINVQCGNAYFSNVVPCFVCSELPNPFL